MRKIIDFLKQIVPRSVWLFFRKGWYAVYDFVRGIGPRIMKRPYCGIKLYYNRGNNIIRRLKKEPIFEVEMCEAIGKELNKSDEPIFVDIGANIGLISSYVIEKVPTLKKIYAFEPGPVQREMLLLTVNENGLSEKIEVSSCALGKEHGQTTFYSHDPKCVANDGLIDTGRTHDARPISVEVDTLDLWWERMGQPKVGVVKIDTEGAELWVLQGGAGFLKSCHPIIFLEIEPRNLRVYPYDHFDIMDFFAKAGYALYALGGETVTRQNFDRLIAEGEDTYMAY